MKLTFENRHGTLAAATATHLYVAPSPALGPFVAHYTLCLAGAPGPGAGGALWLVPDASGCLVFTLEDGGLTGLLHGPSTAAVTVENDLGLCPLRFFVEFRPGGLAAFTAVPQQELAGRVFPLGEIAPALQRAVSACWARTGDLDAFVAAADGALAALCRGDPRFPGLLGRLALRPPGLSVSALALELGYSERHLSRRFREEAGLGPKGFLRVLRVNAAVRRLEAGRGNLTRLAQDLGYFDQSHFIHEFRAVCGVTPTGYLERRSDFYNEPLKF